MTTRIMRPSTAGEKATWEEESGLLNFLSAVHGAVAQFDDAFDFGVSTLPGQPESIDGSTHLLKHLGFVVVRRNSLLTGRDYCLYSVLRGKVLCGYIGIYSGGAIETVRELGHIADFSNPSAHLPGWLKYLVKASCEKI